MKVLQIRYQGERQIQLDLHPQLTVVRGLSAGERTRLAGALAGLPKGLCDGLEGEVEAQGVQMDLTPATLKMLGMSSDVNIVVRPQDLPGYTGAVGSDQEKMAAAKARCDERTTEVDKALVAAKAAQRRSEALTADLDKARGRSAAVADSVIRAASELARAKADHERAVSEVARFEQAVREAKAHHDATLGGKEAAVKAVEAARQRNDQARLARERAAEAVDEAGSATRSDGVSIEVARIRLEERAAAAERAEAAVKRAQGRIDSARAQVAATEVVPEVAEAAPEPVQSPPPEAGGPLDQSVGMPAPEPIPSRSSTTPPRSPDDGEESIVDRINNLERRRAEVTQLLVAVTGSDEDAKVVRDALDKARLAPDVITTGPSRERALGLAARWRDLEFAIAEHEKSKRTAVDGDGDEPAELAGARSRLAKALRTHADAVAAMDTPDVSDTDIEALERAHTAVLDAQEKTDSRFGGGKAKRKLDEARTTEREILDRLGYSTFADYMMSASNRYSGSGDKAVVETAERALTAAKRAFAQEWSKLHPGEPVPAVTPARSERAEITVEDVWQVAGRKPEANATPEPADEDAAVLERRRDDLLREATAVLGHEPADDVAAELEAVEEAPTQIDPRVAKLAEVLGTVGIAVANERLDRNTLVEYADAWLTEQQMSTWRKTELEAELVQVDQGLVKLWDARAAQRRAARDAAAASSSTAFESGAVVVEVDRSRGLFGDSPPSAPKPAADDDVEIGPNPDGSFPYVSSPSTARGNPSGAAEPPQQPEPAQVVEPRPAAAAPTGSGDIELSGLEHALHDAQEELARCQAEVSDATEALEAAERRVALAADVEALLAERQAELSVRQAEEQEAAATLAAAEAALGGFDEGPDVSAAAEGVAAAEAALRTAQDRQNVAAAAVAALERAGAGVEGSPANELAELERQAAEAAAAHRDALLAVETAKLALEAVEAERQALVSGETARKDAAAAEEDTDRETLLEDIEWYLLSRLAAQRSVSEAGSVPLILDDAFADLRADEGAWLLARLERMASAVQIVVLSESPEVAAWGGALGSERVAVVRAGAASTA